jgi:leucyl aminopeptidase
LAVEFSIKRSAPEKQRTACAIVGVFETRRPTEAARRLDAASGGYLGGLLKRGDMDGKLGTALMLPAVPGLPCERLLLVGLGKEKEFGDKAYRDAVRAAVKAVRATGAREAVMYLTETPMKKRDAAWRVEQAVSVAMEVVYRFDRLKSSREEMPAPLARLAMSQADGDSKSALDEARRRGEAIAQGMNLARDLGNLPGNICTPTYLAEQAQSLAEAQGLGLEILERDEMERLGMGSLLSVAKGSDEPPKLIVLRYNGADGGKPVVLVGKGITFDSGGISLKPAPEMDEMKYDMCGAASVLGAMQAAARLALPLNVVGIIPACENLPSGRANKPGDIVTSMSGQTIEVLNTDAEGRLILCDALTYAERFDPAAVIDIATLTGACVIALGHVASGLLANKPSLARELLDAGEISGDRCWQLPLWDEYQEQLKKIGRAHV